MGNGNVSGPRSWETNIHMCLMGGKCSASRDAQNNGRGRDEDGSSY